MGFKQHKIFSIIHHQIKENKPYSWKILSRKTFSFIIKFSVKQTHPKSSSHEGTDNDWFWKLLIKAWLNSGGRFANKDERKQKLCDHAINVSTMDVQMSPLQILRACLDRHFTFYFFVDHLMTQAWRSSYQELYIYIFQDFLKFQ